MASSVLYLLASSAILATVTSLDKKMHLPQVVMSLHEQCQGKRHYSECQNLNRVNGYPHCGRTSCAQAPRRGNRYKGFELRENAPDGLYCGRRKMCYEGSCVNDNDQLPFQSVEVRMRETVNCHK